MIELKPLYRALHFLPHGVGCPYRTSAELRAYRHADLEKGGDGYLWLLRNTCEVESPDQFAGAVCCSGRLKRPPANWATSPSAPFSAL
jgi:hypothetical protein